MKRKICETKHTHEVTHRNEDTHTVNQVKKIKETHPKPEAENKASTNAQKPRTKPKATITGNPKHNSKGHSNYTDIRLFLQPKPTQNNSLLKVKPATEDGNREQQGPGIIKPPSTSKSKPSNYAMFNHRIRDKLTNKHKPGDRVSHNLDQIHQTYAIDHKSLTRSQEDETS